MSQRPSRSRRERSNPFDQNADAGTGGESKRTREVMPRKRRVWPWLLLALLVTVLLLPNLIGWLGLQQRLIAMAAPDFNGKISADKVSLGWFQRVSISGVEATDVEGKPLMQISSISSEKPLYAFLTSSNYGTLTISDPVVYLHLRPDGSNLEDALANYLQPANEPNPDRQRTADSGTNTAALPRVNINLVRGAAAITTSTSPDTWQVGDLNAVVATASEIAPLSATAQCQITSIPVDQAGQSQQPVTGTMAVKTTVDRGRSNLIFSVAELDLQTVGLPVSIAAPIMQRLIGPANAIGTLDADVRAAWSSATGAGIADIKSLQLNSAGLAAPDMLGTDQVYLENVSATGKLDVSSHAIAADSFQATTDFGSVSANGQFHFDQLTRLASNGELVAAPFQMDGKVDLAKVMQLLPQTLHVHKDLVVESGSLSFQASSRSEANDRRLNVNLDTFDLRATRAGQPIVWQKPLRVVGTLKQSGAGMELENLSCESDFLTIECRNATIREGLFTAKGDLRELMTRISQFVFLGPTRARGMMDGTFGWKIASDGASSLDLAGKPIEILGNVTVKNPMIQLPELPRWEPGQMKILASANGVYDASGAISLSQGGVDATIGKEQLVASLAQPVADLAKQENWIFNTKMIGDAGGWLAHIRNFVDVGDVAAAGDLELTSVATVNSEMISATNIQFELKQFGFDGYGVTIREPRAVGNANAVYDLTTGVISIPEASIAGNSISATGQNILFAYNETMQLSGAAAFRADLNRVADWVEMSPDPDSIFWFGSVDGTLQFVTTEQGIVTDCIANVTDMVAAQRSNANQQTATGFQQASGSTASWVELWREPVVKMSSRVTMANDFNAIAMENLAVDSDSVQISANGTIQELASTMVTNLTGTWRPSFEKLSALVDASTGGMVTIRGNQSQPFEIQGPLFEIASTGPGAAAYVPRSLRAATRFGFESASIMDLPVGKTDMQMTLDQQIATINTGGVPFLGTVLSVSPKIDLRTADPVMTVDQSRIVDRLELTPETCHSLLAFVAPLAADAASAQGKFTIDTESVSMPLMNPMNVQARATLTLEDVVIGAGPMAQQVLASAQQVYALVKPEDTKSRDLNNWIRMSKQEVPVVIDKQRVYHDGIQFSQGDVQISTRGSVGFDQTLDMVAEIPVLDKWIEGKSHLESLRGQKISIPIRGTASKPVFDRSAMNEISAQLVRDAASGAINKAIADKVTPKLNEFQNELNDKVTGEVNKLQSKVQDKLQDQLKNSLEDKFKTGIEDKLKNGFGDLLGGRGAAAQPAAGTEAAGNPLEDQLKKGLNGLFGR